MEQNNRLNKNVVAPEQRVKEVTELVVEFLAAIGFTPYGHTRDFHVFRKPLSETESLYCFNKDSTIRMKIGRSITITGPDAQPKAAISMQDLFSCTYQERDEIIALLEAEGYY
jgi:hypothetical protein